MVQYLQLQASGQWQNVELNALEPGDNVSELTNDAGYVTSADAPGLAPVQSVNGLTGAVTIGLRRVG